MIVDFHAHVFPERIAAAAVERLRGASHTVAFTDGTAGALAQSMQKAGVDRTVVLPVATNPTKVGAMNDASIALTERDGLVYFGCIHPDAPNWREELGRIADAGLKGVKIHPVYQGVDLDDMRYLRILDRAAELDLIVVTHAGDDIGYPGMVRCSPEMIAHALRQVPGVRLVAAHMGGWRKWTRAAELLAETGAYIDTSFSLGRLTPLRAGYFADAELQLLDAGRFCEMVRRFGSGRVLFGSDSPWADQAASVEAIRALPLTEAEKADILGENARRLLRI